MLAATIFSVAQQSSSQQHSTCITCPHGQHIAINTPSTTVNTCPCCCPALASLVNALLHPSNTRPFPSTALTAPPAGLCQPCSGLRSPQPRHHFSTNHTQRTILLLLPLPCPHPHHIQASTGHALAVTSSTRPSLLSKPQTFTHPAAHCAPLPSHPLSYLRRPPPALRWLPPPSTLPSLSWRAPWASCSTIHPALPVHHPSTTLCCTSPC